MTVADVRHLGTGLPMAPILGRSEAEFARFLMPYRLAISSLTVRLGILKREFDRRGRHCPIGNVSARVKSLDRIVAKATRLRCPLTTERIRHDIRDIAGIRVTSAVISDTYCVANLVSRQSDVVVTDVEDYIASPKPNGYKSLHITVEVPVFHGSVIQQVPVELQLRTTAMDAWASVEHEIFYANHRAAPRRLVDEMTAAADAAHQLDVTMQRLHDEIGRLRDGEGDGAAPKLGATTRPPGRRGGSWCGSDELPNYPLRAKITDFQHNSLGKHQHPPTIEAGGPSCPRQLCISRPHRRADQPYEV